MSLSALQSLSALSRTAPLRLNPALVCRQCLARSPTTPARPLSLLARKLATNAIPLQPQLRSFSITPRAFKKKHQYRKQPLGLGNLVEAFERAEQEAPPPPKESKPPERNISGHLPRDPPRGRWFPVISDRIVGYWLLGSAGLVFGIVVLGGFTRLTESGLSITEWKPVTGTLPPLSQEDWEENFSKYRDSPEYRILNPNMTLEEYKFIYYMEWSHRLLGRVIGLSFVLPAVYFVARRRVSAKTARRIAGISLLIGFQGFLGWWMVKSGLREDLFAKPGAHPRVSQYRLTAHLGAAFAVYSAMLWSGLDVLKSNRIAENPKPRRIVREIAALRSPALRPFRRMAAILILLTFATAMTGGLVAGLDAGLIYNEFPRMGVGFRPPTAEMFDPFYSHREDRNDLIWRNMLENPSTVQFDHRVMALSTFSTIVATFIYSRYGKAALIMPQRVKKGMMGVLHLSILQVLLGIATLIYMVPTPVAATHQAGSLALLTGTLILGNRLRVPPAAARIIVRRIEGTIRKNTAVNTAFTTAQTILKKQVPLGRAPR